MPLLTVKDVSERLRISEALVRKWILMKKVRFIKVGALVRFEPEVIEEIARKGVKNA